MIQSYAMAVLVDSVLNAKGACGWTVWEIVLVVGEDVVAWRPCPCVNEVHLQLALDDIPTVLARTEFRLGAGSAEPGYGDECQRTKNKNHDQ